jgi:hypothetical protein
MHDDGDFVRCIVIPFSAWSCAEAMMKSSGLSGSACLLADMQVDGGERRT